MLKKNLKHTENPHELDDAFTYFNGYFESLYRVLEVQMFLINASSINSLDAVVFEQKSYKEAVRQPCSGYQE